jgi:hypothetical protein
MTTLRRFVKRLTASLLGRRDDDRAREELAGHLTLLTEEYARRGCHSTRLGGGHISSSEQTR